MDNWNNVRAFKVAPQEFLWHTYQAGLEDIADKHDVQLPTVPLNIVSSPIICFIC